jgi:apolipoprotein N-acyltransferase
MSGQRSSGGSIVALKEGVIHILWLAFAPVLSGALLISAFPPYDLSWCVWVGLCPLIIAIYGRGPTMGFLMSFACGFIFFAGIYDWIFEAPGYSHIHHAIASTYLAPYVGLFGLAFSAISRRSGFLYAGIAAPFVWVCLEYVRSNLGFLAVPFPTLAHSQFQHLSLIQLSSYTGAYGISFMIVSVNCALAATILALASGFKRVKWEAGGLLLLSLSLTALALIYGNAVLQRPMGDQKIRVSVVQGNIGREMKRDPKRYAHFIITRYRNLTERVMGAGSSLIVWPEAATPGFVLKNLSLMKQVVDIVRGANTHVVLGSAEFPKFSNEPLSPGRFGNTALFFSPEGKVLGQYLKMKLIPFGEYLPYEDVIPWPRFIVPENKKGYEIPGKEYTLFELEGKRFGVVICSEGAFPDFFRKFVKRGAEFMVNITNEGWFGETALYQKVAASVFRAVENRISLVRATNTGISCFIDPLGNITGRIKKGRKQTLIKGYLTQDVLISKERTFYTTYGNIFVYACFLMTLLLIALSLSRAKKKGH